VRRPAPDTLPVIATAVLASALLLHLGSRDPYWGGDFVDEAWPAYVALQESGLRGLLASTPAYSGFVTIVGAPSALLVHALWGGVDDVGHSIAAVFRLTALPGIVMLGTLGAVLGRQASQRGATPLAWGLVVALAAGSPIAYQALIYGHPEDLLAAAAGVLAVLAARGGRPVLAGVLLAVAVATKQWAVLAVLPAMLAAPRGAWRIAVIAAAGAAAVLVPLTLAAPEGHHALVNSGALFHPHQVWWPFGVDASAEFTAGGHGEVMAPAWLPPIPHPLIVALALPLAALWWHRAGRGRRDPDEAFALLALLFLERCALDPWNLVYYHLPLVLALLAWEVRSERQVPIVTLGTSLAVWLSFVTYDARTGFGPFLAYFAWALPLAAYLGWTLYRSRAAQPADAVARSVPAPA
jgi:Glycosyltransferase family 87